MNREQMRRAKIDDLPFYEKKAVDDEGGQEDRSQLQPGTGRKLAPADVMQRGAFAFRLVVRGGLGGFHVECSWSARDLAASTGESDVASMSAGWAKREGQSSWSTVNGQRFNSALSKQLNAKGRSAGRQIEGSRA